MVGVKFALDKVQHKDEVVVDRAARESTKLVNIYVGADVRPYPLDQEPLQALAKERGESQVP